MTYYYVHDESGCAFLSDDPPEVVCKEPLVECVPRDIYLRACERYGQPPEPHPNPCPETRRRIRVAVAAWAYEVHNDPIISDAAFDALAREIDLNRSTTNIEMDRWFSREFSPDTGSWVHRHPDTAGLERVYRMLRGYRHHPALWIWMVAA